MKLEDAADLKPLVRIRQIYLDYQATTPVDLRVGDRMLHYMTEEFGNASSIDHEMGDRAEAAIKNASKQVANLINASPREVVFTSGATESINLAIQGTVKAIKSKGITPKVAHTTVEHKAVLDTCDSLQKQGLAELIEIPVNSNAQVDLEYVEQICAAGLHLLCVMAANNEVGAIYPIQEIGQIASRYNIPFLCDASQAIGKLPLNFQDSNITLLAISAHKLYGPKGIGALVIRKGFHLEPTLYGGGHQKRVRPGTLNVPGIVGLGEACHLRQIEMVDDEKAIGQIRDRLQQKLLHKIPDLVINGDINHRLAGNLHISIPGILNKAVIARIRHKLAISTGAACSSGVEAPSHVLRAMNLPSDVIEGALRISLGKFTTELEIDEAADLLSKAVESTRKAMTSV